MKKKDLIIFSLILGNTLLFTFVFSRMLEGLAKSTENSYTAQGIDAYLK